MKVALLGRTRLLYDSIEKVLQGGDDIVLIGTCPAAPEYDIREEDFEKKAKELGTVFFNDVRINSPQITELMKSVNADVAISINWLTIVKQEAISCFKYGILNAHCGDLPRYRGNACPNWAILKGDDSYAISIHYMTPGELDSGDILIKKKYPIEETTTITDIYRNMDEEIPGLFCDALNLIRNGYMDGQAQSTNPNDSLRCYPRIPTDSYLDWNQTCDTILKNIRASAKPFQGAFCYYGDMKLYIYDAERKDYPAPCYVYPGQVIAINRENGQVDIAAQDGIIQLKKIYIKNEGYCAADILKSTRIRLNYCVQDEIYQLKQQIKELRHIVEEMSEKNGM